MVFPGLNIAFQATTMSSHALNICLPNQRIMSKFYLISFLTFQNHQQANTLRVKIFLWSSLYLREGITFFKSLKPTLFILSHNIFSKYWKVFRLSFIWIVFKMGAVWKKPRWNYLKSSFPLSSIKCHLEYILNILFLMDLPPKEVTRPFIEYEMSQQVETIFLAFSSVSSTFLCERL